MSESLSTFRPNDDLRILITIFTLRNKNCSPYVLFETSITQLNTRSSIVFHIITFLIYNLNFHFYTAQ
jgi:hypothetical protein